MKTTLLRLLAIFAVLCGPARAQDPSFVPASGLQLSLTTGGYRFFVGDLTTPTASAKKIAATNGGALPADEGFTAGAVLTNSSRSDVTVEFNDALAALVKFRFAVRDSGGAVVWQSDAGQVSAQVITPVTLGKGQRWKRVVQVPLKVDGAWLKAGAYTLEARTAGLPASVASVPFEVAPFAAAGDTGISGQVFAASPGTSTFPNPRPTPAAATIKIREIRLPNARYDHPEFSFDGKTDENGKFKVATPAGRYIVTATLIGQSGSSTQEVAVEKGAFTEAQFIVSTRATGDTGITGTVLIGPITPVTKVGVPNEAPLANATVTITEVQIPGVLYIRGPWTYTTVTDANGKFRQLTPVGTYRVTAAPPSANPAVKIALPAPVGIEVKVVAGKLTDVTLRVDSGIR